MIAPGHADVHRRTTQAPFDEVAAIERPVVRHRRGRSLTIEGRELGSQTRKLGPIRRDLDARRARGGDRTTQEQGDGERENPLVAFGQEHEVLHYRGIM